MNKEKGSSARDCEMQQRLNALECSTLLVDYQASILSISLNRPEQHNVLSLTMVNELINVFELAAQQPAVRAIVLRGKGKHFCAGGDIGGMQSDEDKQDAASHRAQARAVSRRFGELSTVINKAPQVVLVLLQGAVLGGGLGMACAADIAIADHSAKFAMPETSVGLIPAQISPVVIERIGLSQARRLALLGERIDGQEAWRIGLVHFVTQGEDAMKQQLQAVLSRLNHSAPKAVGVTKQLLRDLTSSNSKDKTNTVLDAAADLFVEALFSDEGQEGTTAFVEKRRPAWAQQALGCTVDRKQ